MGASTEAGQGTPAVRRRRGRRSRGSRESEQGARGGVPVEEEIDHLAEAVRSYAIDLDGPARQRLCRFSRDLIEWNDRLNLLSRTDVPNVVRKHVAASIGVLLVAQPAPAERWIDIGTGAGFPGMVLKLVRPDLGIALVDAARKRCVFLQNTVRQFALDGVSVHTLRAETMIARGEGIGAYTTLTTRAVASLSDTVREFGPLVKTGGRIVTFKGPQWREETDRAETDGSLQRAGFALASATRIPWTPGHLLVLSKGGPSA